MQLMVGRKIHFRSRVAFGPDGRPQIPITRRLTDCGVAVYGATSSGKLACDDKLLHVSPTWMPFGDRGDPKTIPDSACDQFLFVFMCSKRRFVGLISESVRAP